MTTRSGFGCTSLKAFLQTLLLEVRWSHPDVGFFGRVEEEATQENMALKKIRFYGQYFSLVPGVPRDPTGLGQAHLGSELEEDSCVGPASQAVVYPPGVGFGGRAGG